MNQLRAWIVVTFLLAGNASFASQYQVGFKASHESMGAEFAYVTDSGYGSLSAGANIVINNDEYRMLRGCFLMTGDPFRPGLRYGIGFEPVLGSVDHPKDHAHDGDLFAVPFLFQMAFDLFTTDLRVPVDVTLEASFAPAPLTSHESRYYGGIKMAGEYRILTNAGITIEYRYMQAKFEHLDDEWRFSEHLYLIGYILRF
jgi:hypothetical protein